MSDVGGHFRDECGAVGPLGLEWTDDRTGETTRREFSRPAVLVGSHPRADLVIDGPGIGRRHAYLQMIDGRLFAIDLEGGDGLRWSGVPRPSGWLDRRRPLTIGPVTIQRVDSGEAAEVTASPGPTTARFVPKRDLPGVVFEVRGPFGRPKLLKMDRVLVLAGGSDRCQLKLADPNGAKFACAFVRTPAGVWVVDLLAEPALAVNGAPAASSLLEDGDLVQICGQSLRLNYDGTSTSSMPAVEAPAPPEPAPAPSPVAMLPPSMLPSLANGRPAPALRGELVAGPLLRSLVERPEPAENPPGHNSSSSPYGEALVMLVRLLRDVHQDHLKLVREELAEIHTLSAKMTAIQAQLDQAPAARAPAPAPSLPGPASWPEAPRPDPETVRHIVGERLAAWERERESRWRKVLDLLSRN